MELVKIENTTLSISEKATYDRCMAVIRKNQKAMIESLDALVEIHDSRLYRENYSTFDEFCRAELGISRRHAYRMIDATNVLKNVSPGTQILPTTEKQLRSLTSLEPEEQREVWQRVIENNNGNSPTAKQVQEEVNIFKNKPHVSNNSGENEWYTPTEYIEAARRVMGRIDLDPASSEKANEVVKAKKFYTIETDGLKNAWAGNIWMNPPYSQPLITRFCEKLNISYAYGSIRQACVLVNNATETSWFNQLMNDASAFCLVRNRIKFVDVNGAPNGAPLQGQVVLYLGKNVEGFKSEFGKFGRICREY